MGASRRYSRRIKRASQRDENRALRARVAALTEALEVQEAAPVFTDEQSPEAVWEAAGFSVPGEDGLGTFDSDEPPGGYAEEPSTVGAAFRRVTGAE